MTKNKLTAVIILTALALAACAPIPVVTPAPALQIMDIQTRHTAEAINAAFTATAVHEQGDISTQISIEHATVMAVSIAHTQGAVDLEQTQTIATMQADVANSIATRTAYTATAAADAIIFSAQGTATKEALDATAIVQAAIAETVAIREAAEQRKIEMTNTLRSFVPWIIGIGLSVAIIYAVFRMASAFANQKNVIRDSNGDVHTVIIESVGHPVRTVNPDKAVGPVIELGKSVNVPRLASGEDQRLVTERSQMIELARVYARHHSPVKNRDTIRQLTGMLGNRPLGSGLPPASQSMSQLAKVSRGPSSAPVMHPKYNIDPATLPTIPLLTVGSRLVSGGSRSGKTNLVLHDIHRMMLGDVVVYDPKVTPAKWPEAARVITRPAELLSRMKQQHREFEERRDGGRLNAAPSLTIVDEFTALVLLRSGIDGNDIKQAISLIWALVMYGAEFDVNVWILSQTWTAKSLGLAGQGDFRNSVTSIRFDWRPMTDEQMGIPRIAEVTMTDKPELFFVPEHRLPATVPATVLAPYREDASRNAQNAPDGQDGVLGHEYPVLSVGALSVLRDSEAARGYSDDQIRLIWRRMAEGASKQSVQDELKKNRTTVFALCGMAQDIQLKQKVGEQ